MLKTLFMLIALVLCVSVSALAQKAKPKPKPTPKPRPAAASTCAANGLAAAEITELLAGHNKARSDHKLPPLVWDCKLANFAQEWANKGVFEHRNTTFGENIFVASSGAAQMSAVIKAWMDEKDNWTNKTGTCAPGKVCTHYTQMVWNRTTQVGCGVLRNGPGKWKTLLVCNYDPAGNTGGPAY